MPFSVSAHAAKCTSGELIVQCSVCQEQSSMCYTARVSPKFAVLSHVSRLSKYTTKRIPTVTPTLDTHVEKNGKVQGQTGALNKGAFPAHLCN